MKTNIIYQEPCLTTTKRFADNSIDCVISSPPYWQLRDYCYNGQWGLEPNFQLYLEHLWSLMDELYRVLKPCGTCWINLGDTYGTTYRNIKQGNLATNKIKYTGKIEGYKKPENMQKCLLLLPHRFAIGCIDRGWIIRNDCIWAKRNGMPESVTDRFSKKHEYFFFMVKSEKYFFDLNSIRDKQKDWGLRNRENGKFKSANLANGLTGKLNPLGKNPGTISDFWDVTTKGSSNKHYASYNDQLILKPILAGCPEGGVIYDPFIGTGSTAEAAIRANRKFIGSEISSEYCDIAKTRLIPFLTSPQLF